MSICLYIAYSIVCFFTIREMIQLHGSTRPRSCWVLHSSGTQLWRFSSKGVAVMARWPGLQLVSLVGETWGWDDVGKYFRWSVGITASHSWPLVPTAPLPASPSSPEADVVLRNVLCSLLERCGHWPRTGLSRCHKLLPQQIDRGYVSHARRQDAHNSPRERFRTGPYQPTQRNCAIYLSSCVSMVFIFKNTLPEWNHVVGIDYSISDGIMAKN